MEITKFTDAPIGAKYLAEIEVYHNRTFYRRLRLMRSAQGHLFINLPVYGDEDGNGGKRWVQFWEWAKDEENNFKRQLLEAAQPYINQMAANQPYKAPQTQQRPQEQYKAPPQQQYMPNLGECPF